MKFVNVRELSVRLTKIISEEIEKKGERITITKRGKPVAIMVPYSDRYERIRFLLDEFSNFAKENNLKEDLLEALKKVQTKVYD